MLTRCARAVALAAAIAAVAPSPAAGRARQPASSSPCDLRTDERIVAVGDVHGAYEPFVSILRAAQILDDRERWIGGRAILVQTGDVLDRGADSRRVLDLLRRLEREAARAGGRVHALLGNHEVMRLVGDWRYVSAGEFEAFQTASSVEQREIVVQRLIAQAADRARAEGGRFDERAYREQLMKDVPLGYIEMRAAFDARGEYGRWLRARDTAVRINGILFLHGGVSARVAPLGCDGINDAVRKELASLPVEPEKLSEMLALAEDGPLWYRGLAQEPETDFGDALASILDRVGARAIVIGHTTVLPGRIRTRFGGRVMQIDTGMLGGAFYPAGVPAALEIKGGTFTAIYLDRREPLTMSALAGPSASPARQKPAAVLPVPRTPHHRAAIR